MPVYSKVNDSAAIVEAHNAHDGEGTIKVNGLLPLESKIPVNISILELDPGVSEGVHTHEGDDALEEIYYFTRGEGVMSIDGRRCASICGGSGPCSSRVLSWTAQYGE